MLVDLAREVASNARTVQLVVAGVLVKIEAFFRRCVSTTQRKGEISCARPADSAISSFQQDLITVTSIGWASRPDQDTYKTWNVRMSISVLSTFAGPDFRSHW